MDEEEIYWSVKLAINTNDQLHAYVTQHSDHVYQEKHHRED